MSEHFVLIRKACLMEDEGRSHLVGVFVSREKAEEWLDKNAKPTDYFSRSDYEIMETSK